MGYLKLDRQIVDSPIWDDGEPFDAAHAWIDLLLYVNWKDKERLVRKKIVMVKRGSQIVSDQFLANRWHWSRNRVRRYIKMLEDAGMITVNRTADGTWLNVVNYTFFQDRWTANGTTDGTTDGTAGDTTDGTQSNKDNKNNKSEEVFFGADAQKKIPPEFDEVKAYVRSKGYKMEVTEFMTYYEMRGWTLTNGRKITDWRAAVDYWASKSRKDSKADTPPMPYFREVSETAPVIGTEAPYEGGVVAELIRRKRARNA